MIRTDVLHTAPEALSRDALDDLLAVTDAVADQYMITGVNLLDNSIGYLSGRPNFMKVDAAILFDELFDRAMTFEDEKVFKDLLIALRAHAGEPDDDNYND